MGMAFVCPNCEISQALKIEQSMTLPPDSRSDDIMLQIVRCDRCRFRGAAVYEESRRGASESWDHRGYIISEKTLEWLSSLISSCPNQKNKKCHCSAHRKLGKKDQNGRWIKPEEFSWEKTFVMRR
jgi:hypothetical protein